MLDNDSESNASSYKARGPLRNIIRASKLVEMPVSRSKNNEILIEADSSEDEMALDSDQESIGSGSLASMDVASQS